MAQSVNKTVMARCQRMVAGHAWFRAQWTTPHWISSRVATIPSLGVHGFSLSTPASGMKNEEILSGAEVRFSPRRFGFDRRDKLVPAPGHATFFGHLSGG